MLWYGNCSVSFESFLSCHLENRSHTLATPRKYMAKKLAYYKRTATSEAYKVRQRRRKRLLKSEFALLHLYIKDCIEVLHKTRSKLSTFTPQSCEQGRQTNVQKSVMLVQGCFVKLNLLISCRCRQPRRCLSSLLSEKRLLPPSP